MNIGGNGSNPSTEVAEFTEALIPQDVSINHGQSRNPEIDGYEITVVEFTGKPLGSNEDTPDQKVTLVIPTESFLELAATFSRSALAVMAYKAAE